MLSGLLTLVFGKLRSLFLNGTWPVHKVSIPPRVGPLSINFGGRDGASPLKAAALKLSPVGSKATIAIAQSDKIKKYAPHTASGDIWVVMTWNSMESSLEHSERGYHSADGGQVICVGPWTRRGGSCAKEGGRRLVSHFQMVHGLEVALHTEKEKS